jgi:hypothetical protein
MQQQQQQQQQQNLARYYANLSAQQAQQTFRRTSQGYGLDEMALPSAPAAKSPTTFISYRHSDTGVIAPQIETFLKGRFPRDTIFLDAVSIAPGEDFTAAMEAAILASDLLLVLFGQRWLVDGSGQSVLSKSVDHARFEIEMAMRHKKPIVPLLVDGVVMPAASALPPSIASFAHLNGIPVRQGAEFYSDMEKVANIKEQYAPSPPPPSTTGNPASEAVGGVQLVLSIFFFFFPFFPLVSYFMARSVYQRSDFLTKTSRGLLRAAMIISLVGIIAQALVACGGIVALVMAAMNLSQVLPH